MTLIRYEKKCTAKTLEGLHEEIDRLLNTPFAEISGVRHAFFNPSVNVYSDSDNVYIDIELPGLSQKDIKVTVSRGVLIISGKKVKEEKTMGKYFFVRERAYRRFRREIALTSMVDANKIKANYKDGLLCLVLPKRDEEKEKNIGIGTN